MIDRHVHAVISGRVAPGERIVWLGKPEPWAPAGRFALPPIFVTFVTGGMLFGAGNALLSPKPDQNNLGFASIAIVTMLISGAVFGYKALREFLSCWTMTYALTDRRVIVASGGETLSYTAETLGDIWRTGDAKRGSLNFWGGAWRVKRFKGLPGWSYPHGLFGIADPDHVKALIHETLMMPKKKGEPG